MKKEIAFKPNTISIENLPFPIVLYPGHYGAFIAFKETQNSEPYFCSCAYSAIENYLQIRQNGPKYINSDFTKMFIVDSGNFPLFVVEDLINKNISEKEVLTKLNFKDKLCHECNLQTPNYRYCHEMYGGEFKQNYGWYIAKQRLEWGLIPLKLSTLMPELCPEDILKILNDEDFIKTQNRLNKLEIDIHKYEKISNFNKQQKDNFSFWVAERFNLNKIYSKYSRKINNIVENEVRRKFNHKKVGEAWTSETILYYLIKKIYPDHVIHRHYRPKFMEGLELDIYIEGLNVGIEYQGIQHYKPIKHWGGKASLKQLKERDLQKRVICENLKIPLIYFEYNEGLSEAFVRSKLSHFL